ncbi:MAG: co-chaperone GrpE, molecular chaperone GrpE [Candidatus Peregrinibacteria bacterium GW2011_GWF2_43_17]|nr:MAG: co-chaperone GrpE, molecular chaperone GrpE [Candidatus Peregrinibacteria bacterium GW2011_GWF2_43_17]HAU40157.1 nucleotide exchange factor GrpE [Candidatus Peregrinibacteria bacterium]
MTKKNTDIELEKLKAEHVALLETAKRTAADLQNYKRRIEEERSDLKIYANTELLRAVFPVIDNLKRAFDHLPADIQDHEWVKGISSIEKQLLETLTSLGLEPIKTIGEKFNPELHEAVMQGPGEKDQITQEFEKGFSFKGRALKPAKVKVGDGTQ